jgi:hypothetical protein
MPDEQTHQRIAKNNDVTMQRLLNPAMTGGSASETDHPWIAVMAYYVAFHLIEEAVALTSPDCHFTTHSEQVEFLYATPGLEEIPFLYNQLNRLRQYSLYRQPANVTLPTESQILGYGTPQQFKSTVLSEWLEPIKTILAKYRKKQLSVQ